MDKTFSMASMADSMHSTPYWVGDELAVQATIARCKELLVGNAGVTTDTVHRFQTTYAGLLLAAFTQASHKIGIMGCWQCTNGNIRWVNEQRLFNSVDFSMYTSSTVVYDWHSYCNLHTSQKLQPKVKVRRAKRPAKKKTKVFDASLTEPTLSFRPETNTDPVASRTLSIGQSTVPPPPLSMIDLGLLQNWLLGSLWSPTYSIHRDNTNLFDAWIAIFVVSSWQI